MPALVEVFEQDISGPSQDATSKALAGIGPAAKEAIPALLRGATNSEASVRENAVFALKAIAPEAVAQAGVR